MRDIDSYIDFMNKKKNWSKSIILSDRDFDELVSCPYAKQISVNPKRGIYRKEYYLFPA